MGRPGAAHVPAGRPRLVPSYSAIVNILGDGVSLTVILRGYLYRKHQLEGDWVTMQSSTFVLPPKAGGLVTNAHRTTSLENCVSIRGD